MKKHDHYELNRKKKADNDTRDELEGNDWLGEYKPRKAVVQPKKRNLTAGPVATYSMNADGSRGKKKTAPAPMVSSPGFRLRTTTGRTRRKKR